MAAPAAPVPESATPLPTRVPFAAAWMALPIFGVALGQRFVLPGASIADVALGVFATAAVAHLAREGWAAGRQAIPPWRKWLLGLWAWAAVGGFFHIVSGTEPFSPVEFAKSLAKLSFYAVCAVLLTWALRALPRGQAARLVLTAFAAAGGVAIVLYVAMLCGVPLPFQLLWGHGPNAAYFSDLWWFGGAHEARHVFLRAQGLASEPSRLGYLQCMALAYLLLRPGARARFGLRLALILISLLLTFSLTAYALLLPIAALAVFTHWSSARAQPRRRALILAALLLAVLVPLAPTIHKTIVVRAVRSLTGSGDASSFLRVQGNWKMTYYLLETSPVLGVGLGNFDVVAWDLRAFLFDGYLIERDTQGWNVFAYVLATLGVPGLLLLLGLLLSAFRGRGRLALPFVLGMFADGTFLGAAYWLFFALYTAGDAS